MNKGQAQALGEALVQRLGPDWTLRVHENMGWHYSARLGGLSVHEYANQRPHYSVLLGDADRWPGTGIWTGAGGTPEEAIENAVRQATTDALYKAQLVIDARERLERNDAKAPAAASRP